MKFDIIVVGAGVGGHAAALEAVHRGASVLVVDPLRADQSTCRTSAATLAWLRDAALRGSPASTRGTNYTGLRRHARRLLAARGARAAADAERARRTLIQAGVCIETDFAQLLGPHDVRAGSSRHEAGAIILATGSRPRRPRRFPWSSGVVHDSETALATDALPQSVVVVGAEEEGCEFSTVLAALGVQVTLVERRRKLFRIGDRDVLAHLHRGLQQLGITVANEEWVDEVETLRGHDQLYARVRLASGRVEVCERILVLAGRAPRDESLGLDAVGVARDERGFIRVDEGGRTSVPSIFACGDATGPPFRIGTTLWQARAAIAAALGGEADSPPDLPIAVHTIPQIASVGFGEDQCRLLGRETLVGTASERDLILPGLPVNPLRVLKLIFDRADAKLVGAQIAGGAATELIHVASLLLAQGATPEQVAGLVLHHPAQSDSFRVAAQDALRRAACASAPETLDAPDAA
jgi:NAD(P) transhydrogenase